MTLATALPTTVSDWLQIIGALLGIVVLLGGALAVTRAKQWEGERKVLRESIETLQQAREIDKREAQEQDIRHAREIADLRAQLGVLHSNFLAGLAESIVTAVIDTLHPLLPETQKPKRPAPRKATRR